MHFTIGNQAIELLHLQEARYEDRNYAIMMGLKWPDGEMESKSLSVNVVKQAFNLMPGQFFVKNWSESFDVMLYAALVDEGIIIPTGLTFPTGYVRAPICFLGQPGIDLLVFPSQMVINDSYYHGQQTR